MLFNFINNNTYENLPCSNATVLDMEDCFFTRLLFATQMQYTTRDLLVKACSACREEIRLVLDIYIRVEHSRGVFKNILKCNRQELLKVVPHHNEETPEFFWKSVNIFRWRK